VTGVQTCALPIWESATPKINMAKAQSNAGACDASAKTQATA